MGIGSSGGGFAGDRGSSGSSSFGNSGGSKGRFETPGSTGSKPKDSESSVNLATEAPIPGEPQLFAEGDTFHVARVTFTVKLVDETATEPGV